jgi:hypothetical protein
MQTQKEQQTLLEALLLLMAQMGWNAQSTAQGTLKQLITRLRQIWTRPCMHPVLVSHAGATYPTVLFLASPTALASTVSLCPLHMHMAVKPPYPVPFFYFDSTYQASTILLACFALYFQPSTLRPVLLRFGTRQLYGRSNTTYISDHT